MKYMLHYNAENLTDILADFPMGSFYMTRTASGNGKVAVYDILF